MSPVRTPECNFTYTAPPGMPDCGDLPCCVHEKGTTSFWLPDADELRLLNEGGTVAFAHHGKGHPVVGLGVMPAEKPLKLDANDPDWQQYFIKGVATTMRKAHIGHLTIVMRDTDAIYEMDPEQSTRKNLIILLLQSPFAGIRFTPEDAKELCDAIQARATLPSLA